MKTKFFNISFIVLAGIALGFAGYNCSGTKKTAADEPVETIVTNAGGKGININLEFRKGASHNHPLMVIWTEDTAGQYIETLYIAQSIGTGIFLHGDRSQGQWQPGPIRRPAALPYWGHQRGIQAKDGLYIPGPDDPMPDAVSGPTPAGNFDLQSKTTGNMPSRFKILLEINQSWDWNTYWSNSKYQGDENYRTSSQPSVIYEALIDLNDPETRYTMIPVGHGHYSGADGRLYPDLSTLTTALDIVESISVSIDPQGNN